MLSPRVLESAYAPKDNQVVGGQTYTRDITNHNPKQTGMGQSKAWICRAWNFRIDATVCPRPKIAALLQGDSLLCSLSSKMPTPLPLFGKPRKHMLHLRYCRWAETGTPWPEDVRLGIVGSETAPPHHSSMGRQLQHQLRPSPRTGSGAWPWALAASCCTAQTMADRPANIVRADAPWSPGLPSFCFLKRCEQGATSCKPRQSPGNQPESWPPTAGSVQRLYVENSQGKRRDIKSSELNSEQRANRVTRSAVS